MSESKGIRAEKLNIGYSSDLIKDICIEAAPGRIVTLIGPNGSGKTTLLRTLTGELEERGGIVYISGEDRSAMSASSVAKAMSIVMTEKLRPELMTCRNRISLYLMSLLLILIFDTRSISLVRYVSLLQVKI